jgi:phosphoribosylamine--glycine ligase
MKVLVVGGGGREHALCWRLKQHPRVRQLYCAPGNAGTASLGQNVPFADDDLDGLLSLARAEKIDLTIVGPEAPLCEGIVDRFEAAGLRIFGPNAAAARIESDKAYAKALMRQQAVPTADARIFDDYEAARTYVATRDYALVVKASGLAKGKGVIVCDDPSEALIAIEKIMKDRKFGDAGAKVVVEERLTGPEVSILAFVSGSTIYIMESAADHKPIGEGDVGPNTGGMGSYSPTPLVTEPLMRQIEREILVPIVSALSREEAPYRGVLYAGLMLTPGGPKVLEFNCRMGDPEGQALLMRLRGGLLEAIEGTIDGALEDVTLDWDDRASVCVVVSASGYPDYYEKGAVISGLEDVPASDDLVVFHAGTERDEDGNIVTAGGRVLGVTALGKDLSGARHRAYAAIDRIDFQGRYRRRDIGERAATGRLRVGAP